MNKMKKLLIIILGIFLIGFVFEGIIANKSNVYKEQKVGSIKKNKKLLSINLEQTAGAGDYKTVTQSNWPTDGYVFNEELSKCENGSTLSWDEINKKVIVSGSLTDKCYVYFDKILTLAEYVKSQYTGTQGENGIYYHNSTLTNGAGDNSYRYAGTHPNNYVCFGTDASTCPEDNLYRIIGVFGSQVKLIKATIAKSNLLGTNGAYYSDTDYRWSLLSSCPSSTAYNSSKGIYRLANKNIIAVPEPSGCNEWNYSDLNTINLNANFIKNIGTTWSEKIATTTWKVGGGSWANIATSVPKTAYQYEVGSSASSTTYDAKIGLMYVTDYYYGASSSAWTLVGSNGDSKKSYRAATGRNWLYLGSTEWTISRCSGNDDDVFNVYSAGFVSKDIVDFHFGVRPVFNLLSYTTYVSGSGGMSDPIKIN